MSLGRGGVLLIAASAAVGAAVVAALIVVGPPAEQRRQRLDELRAQDLAMLERAVNAYARAHGGLPADLDTAALDRAALKTRDPQSGAQYVYEILGTDRYRLCATFTGSSAGDERMPFTAGWPHGPGRTCFERVAR